MKNYLPMFSCVFIAFLLFVISFGNTSGKHFNTYPNLPAPIGKEKILITSAGQAAEGTILSSIAKNLNLEADFRPRALASDLYDYRSIVILLGYSANGLSHTPRSFKEELIRIEQLVGEAELKKLPVILINLSGTHRGNAETEKLFKKTVTHADYYIGIRNRNHADQFLTALKTHHVPATLVNQLDEIATPFNSTFR